MSNIHAAIGLSQLAKFETISETRRNVCIFYNEELSVVEEIITPTTDFKDITPFLYYIRVPKEKKSELRDYMINNGIDIGVHWQPGHWFELFQKTKKGDLSVTDKIANEILSLPLHSCMKEEDMKMVVKKLKEFFQAI
jgi:dTDP-4-amino-4,6-dideoxygalactose transaminase